MEPVKQKTFFVRGEYVTAGLIGVLVITVFGGGIFLFKNISPSSQDQIPKPSADQSVLSAAATPVPTSPPLQQVSNDLPAGPTPPKTTPKATAKPTSTSSASVSPTPTPNPSASPTASPSPSTKPIPNISFDSISQDAASVTGQLTIKASSDATDLKSISLYLKDDTKETFIDSKTTSPAQFTWDSTTVPNGPYTLKVETENNSSAKNSSSKDITVHN